MLRWCVNEGDRGIFPKRQVDNGDDIDGHEREDDDADKDIGDFGKAIVYEPIYKANAQIIDVDANDA